MAAVQVRGEVLSTRRMGDYHALTVVAPGIAEGARPGHFVSLAVGGEHSSMLLRRAFSIYRVQERGVYGGTVEIIFAVAGKGTAWLAERRAHDALDVVGPLGRPFSLPKEPVATTLVGGGYGSAPLFTLAEQLRSRGCRVDFVIGASTEARLFGALEAKRMSTQVAITTEDGSVGDRGRVTDVLPAMLRRSGSDVVYACGPMPMLRAVHSLAVAFGAHSQCAVEEAMACGVGVCMTCVLPVVGEDGESRLVRSCTDGPVFDGDRIRWDDIGTGVVPSDVVGAPAPPPSDVPAAQSAQPAGMSR
jgi:dihydroorotate dehydrogenase electron transfer subunit